MPIDLQQLAHKIRLKTFKVIAEAGGGHFGGCLSTAEILTALFFSDMNIDAKNPKDPERDRLLLSKGHGGPALYVALSEKGLLPEELLAELDKSGGHLPKHADLGVSGVEASTGSLGQGLSIGIGMALASRLDKSARRIYVVMGDGECNEGQVWEAAICAAKYKLDNLVAIIDRNRVQVDGTCAEIMPTDPMDAKWAAFGWKVLDVDGHKAVDIAQALKTARQSKGQPTMIIARTVKGKGISFMENQAKWHSSSVTEAEYRQGVVELERMLVS
jgi:transketolase